METALEPVSRGRRHHGTGLGDFEQMTAAVATAAGLSSAAARTDGVSGWQQQHPRKPADGEAGSKTQ